jgi:hypothetical protein
MIFGIMVIQLLSNLKIPVADNIYIKYPKSSNLARRIVQHSILPIDDMGIDSFMFKKFEAKIENNKSSIYRF